MRGNEVDLECGIPVAVTFEPTGRVAVCELPGGRAATTMHVGPYDQLRHTWQAMWDWVKSEGLAPAGPPWEVYIDDPTTVEAARLRTEVYVPLPEEVRRS